MKGLNLTEHNGVIVAKLYRTTVAVITFTPDFINPEGDKNVKIELSHGGYITNSTSKALNAAFLEAGLPLKAFVKKGEMYMRMGNIIHEINEDLEVKYDGKTGTIYEQIALFRLKQEEKQKAKELILWEEKLS